MVWLQRRAWWLLLTMTVLVAVIGLNPVISGINEDVSVPLGITGLSAAELQAESAQGYRLIDFGVPIMIRSRPPLRSAAQRSPPLRVPAEPALGLVRAKTEAAQMGRLHIALNLAFGVAPGQAPPTPMISGPIFAVLAAAILLVSAPRFVGRQPA